MDIVKEMIIEVPIGAATYRLAARKVCYTERGAVTFYASPTRRRAINAAAKRARVRVPFYPDDDLYGAREDGWTACSIHLLSDDQAAELGVGLRVQAPAPKPCRWCGRDDGGNHDH